MSNWKDRLVGAVLAEFPGASPATDFFIESSPDGPVIKVWNEDVLGPYVEADWQAKCEALMAVEFVEAVKLQIAQRITSVASASTQMNLTAAHSAGLLTPEQQAAYLAGLGWIAATRQRGKELVAAHDPDFAEDEKWPLLPDGVAELAALF
ncbi:hypothetical protein [Roseibium sediminis]|uniref:hypothetical protein n=1 Tax=Roseibium sediminis TaxID=1775174 RepID=UPI00123DF45C|nr:hypothetical protein [Roseibium sediminis]